MYNFFSAPQEWPDYVSGWGAAVVNIFVTFPINKTMFRQQVHGVSTINAIKMLKEEGAIYLYRGILPPLLQKSTSTCIMFGTYSHYNRLMSDFLGIDTVSCDFSFLLKWGKMSRVLIINEYYNSFFRILIILIV